MPILNPNLKFVDKFLQHFSPIFTKKQFSLFKAYVYAMFLDYKRLSLSTAANTMALNYQQLQYFFSESDWDITQLNNIRLRLLQRQRTTQANNNCVLAIDDTGCPKPYALKTEGAKFQYCGPLHREENCNVAVASCFVSNSKHFPVNFKSYLPIETQEPKNFKSKLDLAKDLISDALNNNIPFSSVVVDSWYTSSDLIEFVSNKNLSLIAEVKSNRSLFFTHPQTKQWRYLHSNEVIALVKQFYPHKLKAVSIPQEDGELKSIFTYSFDSKLKDCPVPVRIVILFGQWSKTDENNIHLLISTNLKMSAKNIIQTYLLRWGIEQSFRELKDSFCFDQYQVRHQKQIQRHWIMSFLAWSLTYWIKQNACLSKILTAPPETLGQCKQNIASLIIIDSAFLLSKNKELAASLFNIKSERFRKKLEN